MYDLGPEFENTRVPPGTNLLLAGPPLSGVRRLAFEAAAHDTRENERTLVITARYRAEHVRAEIEERFGGSETVGIVDCVTGHQGRAPADSTHTRYAASPGDLTGIGTAFAELVQESRDRGVERLRIVLDSISMFLPYTNLQTVFEFVHVLTNRIDDIGALGLHVIEAPAHSSEDMHTLEQLFDAVVAVENDSIVTGTIPEFGPEPSSQ